MTTRMSAGSLKIQRIMLVAVLALGAVLPISVIVSRSGGSDLGPEVGASIDAFGVLAGRSLVAGSDSSQVHADGVWNHVASLDGDQVTALAYADDLAFALTDQGLVSGDEGTLDFAPSAAGGSAGPSSGDIADTGFVAMGAAGGTVYLVASTGSTQRVDVSTGTVLSRSEAVSGAPVGQIAVDLGDSSIAWGVNADQLLVKTEDAGGSWVEQTSMASVVSVASDESVPARVGVLDEDGVSLSTDAGITWDRIDSPPDLQAIAFDATTLYGATTVDGRCLVFKLSDGTWTVVR